MNIYPIVMAFVLFLIMPEGRVNSGLSYSSEICNNALDDDGDGLVDLNDSDCFCPLLEPISIIPNPSFENVDCCPEEPSSLDCATDWVQASRATTDYYNLCDFSGLEIFDIPLPIPDGEGYIGFFDGIFGSEMDPNYKEYVGNCLTEPMEANTTYRLQFNIGFLDRESSPSTDIAIFGTEDCSNLPFGEDDFSFGCPTNGPGWVRLGAASVFGDNEWKQFEIKFTPKNDIVAVVLGPDCAQRVFPKSPYYFLDHLILAEDRTFEVDISANDRPCPSELALEITSEDRIVYQWYIDGVAIRDANASVLQSLPGRGEYQVRIENEQGCKISRSYIHDPPFQTAWITESICQGDSLLFGTQLLTTDGTYIETLQTVRNCDSIVHLELIINHHVEKFESAKIFPSEVYELGEEQINTPGEYIQTVTSNSGCDSTIYLNLDFYSVYVPNAFSPNGDGVNDVFMIQGAEDLVSVLSLNIYTRWGNQVYSSSPSSYEKVWDGTSNGTMADTGIYVCEAVVLMDDNKERTIYGDVVLIR